MADDTVITPHSLDLYLCYRRLTTRSLGTLLGDLASVADLSVRAYAEAFALRIEALPTLEVESVHTGGSVKFTFGEGWLPSVTTNEEHDIIINVPKKLGIPLLVGYLLLNGASQSLNVRNAYLDSRIKALEIQLKESEIKKALRESRSVGEEVQHRASRAVDTILRDQDYTKFVLYDIDLIEMHQGPRDGRSGRNEED